MHGLLSLRGMAYQSVPLENKKCLNQNYEMEQKTRNLDVNAIYFSNENNDFISGLF